MNIFHHINKNKIDFLILSVDGIISLQRGNDMPFSSDEECFNFL